MTTLEELDGLCAKAGVSLAALGIHDIGLLRSDALNAVEIARHAELPILGGDVYFRRGDRIELARANWHVSPMPPEEREAYLRRSWDEAEGYIKNFPEPPDAEVLFGIVFRR
jgi:Immunity protein 40